ncbi:NADH-quinone oxidoreductase subunit L [Thermogemmatispora aurantia]|jgi:NADH-quinone oxidoreductase subunit L|uniref:NADH-quinone oxidoreductase subunit L n=1 Tax=Thermogemmatispora aurantia TaxID=2045279 RepID=A0A5J4KAP0_9CHLR|nr:NADH-quinone oxidoreductase subunit L [Thermogemmatispora aurantia]GER85634.1 NADH-quinone oxidoreductase subunit L [Thermogemmatispora aurantia]
MASLLLWVLIPPLLGFIILGLLGRTLPRSAILTVAWGTVALSFLFALSAFLSLLGVHPDSQRVSDASVYTWAIAGDLQVHFGLLLDPLSATMLLVITGVGLLIHIYSAGYMADDPGFWRFFSYMNFFIFAMTLLVSADNLLFLLVGWGLVGLASFLLIGFWYQRPAATAAARKALVINVIGDFGLMLAIFLLFKHLNTVDYGYGGPNCIPGTSGYGVLTAASCQQLGSLVSLAIPLLLFVACAAKSAQLPLYMWLPDAMEGPTPVSALIHAATMVTAGVYLVARTHVLFTLSPYALPIVGAIGGLTALFAATIALTQLDIKRVLAYSTISQLGYMFMGESAGSYSAGIFHLTTHAYFKALLFLGAGAVIHALGGEQDMREMGGLRYRMRITFWTFLIAVLAISGIPPFAGFWSKDDILGALLTQATSVGGAVRYLYYGLWGLGVLTAGLTALYMFRLFYGIFMGSYRGAGPLKHGHAGSDEEEEEEEEEVITAAGRRRRGESALYEIYEAPAVMTVPLVILAILSTIGGLVGSFALFNYSRWQPLNTFLEPVLGSAPEGNLPLLWLSTGASLIFALLGLLIAWRRYGQGFVYKESRNPFYRLAYNKYYVDEIGVALLINPLLWLGRQASALLEGGLLDGGSRLVGRAFSLLSAAGRRLQTGYVRNYALAILIGVVLIILYYVVRG